MLRVAGFAGSESRAAEFIDSKTLARILPKLERNKSELSELFRDPMQNLSLLSHPAERSPKMLPELALNLKALGQPHPLRSKSRDLLEDARVHTHHFVTLVVLARGFRA